MKTNPSKTRSFQGLGIDILWLFVILVGALVITSLIPLVPNDYWWHLKVGEWIYTHRTIPSTNIFAWTLPADTPYYYGTWLGELCLYLVYRLGKIELTIFMRTLLFGITLWCLGYEAKRRTGSWRLAALIVALGSLMSLSNVQIRTQIWSWFPFVIYLILLSRYSDRQLNKYWLLVLPALMLLWVNSHGAFILGLVLIGVYLLGESLSLLLKLPVALSLKDVLWLAVIGLTTGFTTLLNPRFLGIIEYVLDLMTDKPSQQLIIEWQSPAPQGLVNITFFISLLVLMICLAYSKYRLTPTATLTIISFTWLAWSGQRYIVWYALTAMPILAQAIAKLPIHLPSFEPVRSLRNVFIVLLLFVPVVFVQPWFVEKIPLPDTYWKQVLRDSSIGPLLSVDNPIAAVEYLKSHPGGNLFNEMGYGSYLIWALPGQGVFVDPRVELYPYEQWQDYIRITRGANYNRILEQYGADRILLSIERQSELSQILASDPHWRLEYEDPYAQIWNKVSNE